MNIGNIKSLLGVSTIHQLVRYGIIGLTLNGVCYATYLLLTSAGMSPYLTVTILYPISILLSFFLNRSWTFGHQGNLLNTFLKFILAHIGGYILNLALLAVFSDWIGYPHQLVQFAAIFVVAAFLFVSFRSFVYTSPPAQDTSASSSA